MLDDLFKATDRVSAGARIPSNVFLAPKLFLLCCTGILGMLVWQKLIGMVWNGSQSKKVQGGGSENTGQRSTPTSANPP